MRKLLLIFIVFLIGVSGCTLFNQSKQRPNSKTLSRELTAHEKQLVEAGRPFGYELFRKTASQDSGKNIFISPLSVSMALGMTLNGAADSTKIAMKDALHLQSLGQESINKSYTSLIDLLRSADSNVDMKLANSIWIRQGFPVQDAFMETCKNFFKARIESLDFSDPSASDKINKWVSDNTEGLIQSIIQGSIPQDVVMYLINAIYFKGNWRYQFDESETASKDFYLPDGTTNKVDMMKQKNDLAAYISDQVQMLDLSYGDSLFTMTLMMPGQKDKSINKFVSEDLTAENVHRWISNLSKEPTRVEVPKFKMSYQILLKKTLKKMGMGKAFDPNKANFSNINPDEKLFISKVNHKAFVKVDEKGTEAAAVTSVSMGVTSVGPKIRTIKFDRPFVFLIRERTSGTILFMGIVQNPIQ